MAVQNKPGAEFFARYGASRAGTQETLTLARLAKDIALAPRASARTDGPGVVFYSKAPSIPASVGDDDAATLKGRVATLARERAAGIRPAIEFRGGRQIGRLREIARTALANGEFLATAEGGRYLDSVLRVADSNYGAVRAGGAVGGALFGAGLLNLIWQGIDICLFKNQDMPSVGKLLLSVAGTTAIGTAAGSYATRASPSYVAHQALVAHDTIPARASSSSAFEVARLSGDELAYLSGDTGHARPLEVIIAGDKRAYVYAPFTDEATEE